MTEPCSAHLDRDAIDAALVARLIAAQFPQWAHLPVTPIAPGGWDNRTFRVGEDLTARLPSAEAYVAQVDKEHRWLPRLAPHLPLPIPVPVARGRPGDGYPWPWSICRWLDGEPATTATIADLRQCAMTLAEFLVALQQIEATDGPAPGPHNFFRGGAFSVYDHETRRAIAALNGAIDAAAATAIWETALAATWQGAPVWVHGDVAAGNLLVQDGQLRAVIDFSCAAVGDPACDLAIAWTLFAGDSRQAFRAALPLDAGTWARGRGWTLWKAVIILANPGDPRAADARRVLDAVLADETLAE